MGFFITVEGGEASGKTTFLDSLFSKISKKNRVIKTREPGSTKIGEELRDLVLHYYDEDLSKYTELTLFLASRAQHIKEIINPALANGSTVLCDRFNDSSVVYQGYARALGLEKVKSFCDFISDGLTPDITFYLDIDPRISLKRLKKIDRIEQEKIDFHDKVRKGFLLLAKNDNRFFVINANQSKENILQEAVKELTKRKICF